MWFLLGNERERESGIQDGSFGQALGRHGRRTKAGYRTWSTPEVQIVIDQYRNHRYCQLSVLMIPTERFRFFCFWFWIGWRNQVRKRVMGWRRRSGMNRRVHRRMKRRECRGASWFGDRRGVLRPTGLLRNLPPDLLPLVLLHSSVRRHSGLCLWTDSLSHVSRSASFVPVSPPPASPRHPLSPSDYLTNEFFRFTGLQRMESVPEKIYVWCLRETSNENVKTVVVVSGDRWRRCPLGWKWKRKWILFFPSQLSIRSVTVNLTVEMIPKTFRQIS